MEFLPTRTRGVGRCIVPGNISAHRKSCQFARGARGKGLSCGTGIRVIAGRDICVAAHKNPVEIKSFHIVEITSSN
jgi:hypothetical protein